MIHTIELNGIWQLTDGNGESSLAGQVPGDVVADLLRAGRISDPYYRENEQDVQWIGERDWTYERAFTLSDICLQEDTVLLRCEGLDTCADVRINGQSVAATDNMHRTYEWDVKPFLKSGENTIAVTFRSANIYTREQRNASDRPLRDRVWDGCQEAHPAWIRKEACNFGWDWGPVLVTAGIWRSLRLISYSGARLSGLHIRQEHQDSGAVELSVNPTIDNNSPAAAGLKVRVSLSLDGDEVAAAEGPADASDPGIGLTIDQPRLWWPAGMGAQPLYDVCVDLVDDQGRRMDTRTKRIGLRTLKLDRHADQWGESFQFVANGVPFFAKGANWIPVDAVLGRRSPEMYRSLLADSVAANMNMIRVWGGGIYEDDCFYDICDELGICIWQDFMFACMAYPCWDEAFRANVKAEAEDNVRRLRHHPCLALWCGNNELEQMSVAKKKPNPALMSWEEYGWLFDDLLPGVVQAFDPDTDYWPSSSHTPQGDRNDHNDPTCGDAHLWDVWHGKKPFEWYRTCDHRFNSEFGFQSFPEPKTVDGYTAPKDRNVTTAVMEHHQRSGIGNTTIMQYMLDWFRLPTSFDMVLRTSQILQGMAMKYAVEHWRRSMPRGMGTLYWQLNDCWPVASWASIDYHGRWKALHYMARHFYAPVLVSGLEDAKTGTIDVFVNSDRLETFPANLAWSVTDVSGEEILSGEQAVNTPVNGSAQVATLDLQTVLAETGSRNLLVWLELTAGDNSLSTNLVTFARPKHLELADAPGIAVEVTETDQGFQVKLGASRPALWTWLEFGDLDVRLSDNYVHLRPGAEVVINLCPPSPVSLDELRDKLIVRSLVDTYA